MRNHNIFKSAVLALLLASLPLPAVALEAPKGQVVLTISGSTVTKANVGDTAQFDLDMLEGLPGRTARITTPWTTGETEFSGPYLREVLRAAGVEGTEIRVIALNDYHADVPTADAELDTILATRVDGQRMSVREKGPLFLIYPFDQDASLYNEKYFSRSVWQIVRIEVID